MLMRSFVALLLLTVIAFAQSQPPSPTAPAANSSDPKNTPTNSAQTPASDQRGTDKSPLVIKLINTGQSDAEAAENATRIKEKSADDRWATNINIGLTVALVVAALLQFGALLYQAHRLRQSIVEMKNTTTATVRAAKAAETSAKVAEKALTEMEAPYVFIKIIDTGLHIRPPVRGYSRSRLKYTFIGIPQMAPDLSQNSPDDSRTGVNTRIFSGLPARKPRGSDGYRDLGQPRRWSRG